MNPAAHTFRIARKRRSQSKSRNGLTLAAASEVEAQPQLADSVLTLPSSTSPVLLDTQEQQEASQPVLLTGLASPEAPTVSGVSGASAGPLQLDGALAKATTPAADSQPVLLDRRSRPRNGRSVRALNVAIAAVLLVFLAPVMLIIAVAVRLTSKGPIIYKQVRVGRDRRGYEVLTPASRRAPNDRRSARDRTATPATRAAGLSTRERARQANADRKVYEAAVSQNRRGDSERRGITPAPELAAGESRRRRIANAVHDRRTWNTCGETFTMFKFRTMRVDAEVGGVAVWAQKKDPRVTPIGGFLRKCRLDELPQIFNVLRGDMNIVGPRPERPTIIPNLVESISYYPIRQRTRPGITGLAQIRHSYDTSIDDVRAKVGYDLEYLRSRSVLKDLRIMVETPLVMFFKRTGH
jgi:lipopolysaccharide/colanic/teichoic acid biosynthesis glycosyltransferase